MLARRQEKANAQICTGKQSARLCKIFTRTIANMLLCKILGKGYWGGHRIKDGRMEKYSCFLSSSLSSIDAPQ